MSKELIQMKHHTTVLEIENQRIKQEWEEALNHINGESLTLKNMAIEINTLKKENEDLWDQIEELETALKPKGGDEAWHIRETLTKKLNDEK